MINLDHDAREGVSVCGFGGSPHTVVGSPVESQVPSVPNSLDEFGTNS